MSCNAFERSVTAPASEFRLNDQRIDDTMEALAGPRDISFHTRRTSTNFRVSKLTLIVHASLVADFIASK
jgi:hypothetical protein